MNKIVIGLAGLAVLCSCGNKDIQEQTKNRPNIILIMADDVTPEHFSCLGGDIPTPNIDRLAAGGMIFNRAYAPSAACTPSRYSIMTGQYPGRCQAKSFLGSIQEGEPYKIAWNTPITEDNFTLHEVLTRAGYFTGYVGKFHIGDLDFNKPEANPHIPYIDPESNPEDPVSDSLLKIHQSVIENRVKELTGCSYTAAIQWENPEQLPIKAISNHNLEWLTSGAAEFLAKRDTTLPFFLHFNTTALHGPNHFYDLHKPAKYTPEGILKEPYLYHPPRKTIFERLIALGKDTSNNVPDYIRHYDAGILYLDDQVGAILNMLEEKGIGENTIVILTADHAIEPGKSTCYERGLRVPFIVSWPSGIKAGSECNELIQFTDFLPTFAKIAGANIDTSVTDGISFLPLLKGEESHPRSWLYSEEGYTRAVTGEKFKFIAMRFPEDVLERLQQGNVEIITHFGDQFQAHGLIASKYHDGYFDADQLYDLENDPWEQVNLAYLPEYKNTLDSLRSILTDFCSSYNHPYPIDNDGYMQTEGYRKAVRTTKNKGTDEIKWWDRELIYPPVRSSPQESNR